MLLVILSCIMSILFVLYNSGPTLQNPFNNHWTSSKTVAISLTFIFAMLALGMIFQTYFSVLVFRILCDVSFRYPMSFKTCRIKLVLLYCYAMSLLTVGGFVLKLQGFDPSSKARALAGLAQ